MIIKNLKPFIPKFLLFIIRKVRVTWQHLLFSFYDNSSAMNYIYKKNYWGANSQFEYYSGSGSHKLDIINPYIKSVNDFLSNKNYVVLDLGCGDFNVGSSIYKNSSKYIACDIVSDLISYNKKKYIDDKLEFYYLDICNDDWPNADVVIIRQVLQHLSNSKIKKVIKKLSNYKYAIITEGVPVNSFLPNVDNFTGPDIRLSKKSGVVLHEDPFSIQYTNIETMVEVFSNDQEAIIRTLLYQFK
jgi:SAM-dependent methyltransferase